MLESAIQSKIIKALKKKGCYIIKVMKASKDGVNDLICCAPCVITKEMVGKRIGLFYSIEVKDDKNEMEPLQVYNQEKVVEAGGRVVLARCASDAVMALK